MTRLVCAVVVFAAGVSVRADDRFEATKEKIAEINARSIRAACEAYYVKHAAYPTKLLDLVKPPGGGPSYLKEGAKDLLDPWGKEYKYEVATDEKDGSTRAHVWCERTVDG